VETTLLSFKKFLYLIEAKIDDFKSSVGDISIDHDPHGEFKTPFGIVDHFHKHNPTGDVNHTSWIVDQYKKGNLKQEDAPSMKDTLTDFNRNRNKLQKKQLNQYKDISSLRTALREVQSDPTKSQIKKAESNKAVIEGSTPVEDSDDLKLYHVHTMEAAQELGKGMPWCTSHRDPKLNRFNSYNKTSNNRFYIAHLPNEQSPYRKLGIAVGQGEFQDENNRNIPHEDLVDLVKRNPTLGTTPRLQGVRVATTQDHEKHIGDLSENDLKNFDKTNFSSEELDKLFENENDNIRQAIASHPNISKNLINKALNDKNSFVRNKAISNKNATPEHIDKALNGEDMHLKFAAIKNPNASSKQINQALNGQNIHLKLAAIDNPSLTSDHIDKLLNDDNYKIRESVASHPNASEKQISKALEDETPDVRVAAITSQNATSKHIDKALEDEEEEVRLEAISHPNATSQHIDKALDDDEPEVKSYALAHPNSTTKHISKALNDDSGYIRLLAIQHPKATKEHYDIALRDKYLEISSWARKNYPRS
jgi:hypothetical protein